MPGPSERRTSRRARPDGFAMPFGEVFDVSGSGVRVSHRGPRVHPGETLRLTLRWAGESVYVVCVVRRAEPAGFRRQTLGLEWVEAPEGLEDWLTSGQEAGAECVGPRLYRRSAAA